jgi:hypothetical protein
MSDGANSREVLQGDLDALKERLAAMENGWTRSSDGVAFHHASPEEIKRVRVFVASLASELAEDKTLVPQE